MGTIHIIITNGKYQRSVELYGKEALRAYHKRYIQKILEFNPDYYKQMYQRILQVRPDYNKRRYQRYKEQCKQYYQTNREKI
jgi:hypothetical protein